MPDPAPIVFISYSHDSAAHNDRVLQFANALRSHGVDVELDRYEIRPPKGWPNWCEEQLRPEKSNYVLMVCTKTYKQRIQDKVPADEGRGVFWEGAIIFDYIYDRKGNTRFIPILFDDENADSVPPPILNHTHYRIHKFSVADKGYQDLYRELTRQPNVTKPPLGNRISLSLDPIAAPTTPLDARPVRTNFPPIANSTDPSEKIGSASPRVVPGEMPEKIAAKASGLDVSQPGRSNPQVDPAAHSPVERQDDEKVGRQESKFGMFVAPPAEPVTGGSSKPEIPADEKPAHWIIIQLIVFFLVMLGIFAIYLVWKFFGPSNQHTP